jgi:hypothetical protein
MKTQNQSCFTFGKLLAVAAACLAFQSAQATLLFQDGFNYAAGGLNASDVSTAPYSGNAWSSGSSHITVVANDLTYPSMADLGTNAVQDAWGVSAGSVINTFANQTGVGNSVYYSFLVQCTAAPAASAYLTDLNPLSSTPNGSSDPLAVYVQTLGSGWEVGVASGGSAKVYASSPTTLLLNTTYLIVAEYTFGTAGIGTANIYIDPTVGGTQPVIPYATVNSVSASSTAIDNLGFKAQSSAGGFLLDNAIVGTTWQDVTTAVPEPSTLALAGLGLIGLVARFRRARE